MNDKFNFGGEIVWKPSKEYIERSNLKKFMDIHNIRSFDELMEKSITNINWFTEAVLNFLDIKFHEPYTQILDLSDGIQFPRWCINGKMNIVFNCFEKRLGDEKAQNRRALIWEGEEGISKSFTYLELSKEVNKCANALRKLGLRKGDVIALFMPMIPEIVIAFFAVAKIGGVILPLFSGYGAKAISQRINDANAKCLFTSDGFFRRGKHIKLKETADEALLETASVEYIIVVNRANINVEMKAGKDYWWKDLVDNQATEAELEITSAEDLLMILYTSGTTGKPKGVIHTHCGFPVKAAQDMAFGTDVHPGDIIYWMTDMGWMMGPWLILGTALLGATSLIYDGAPDYPAPDRLWKLVEDHKINVLGLSPTLVRSLITYGDDMVQSRDFTSLKFFASTSEPWNPDPWLWLFNIVGEGKRPIINYSGGTEISGGIVMGNPLLPIKPTAFAGPCPGIAADVFDENGNSIIGEVGELVIKAPWIGMTRGFLKDKQRYIDSYWSIWKNVWVHGDWAAIDEDGMWYILGRSDDTIKVSGKRVGPAEIESILVNHKNVIETAAIGVPHNVKGNEVVCFCVIDKYSEPLSDLKTELQILVSKEMGKPLKPQEIYFVSDLPKTRNGKVMRRIIKNAFLKLELGDISSLQNPDTIEEIKNLV